MGEQLMNRDGACRFGDHLAIFFSDVNPHVGELGQVPGHRPVQQDMQLGYGANQEVGFLKDWDGTTKVYSTTGLSAGPAIGVDFGLSLGL